MRTAKFDLGEVLISYACPKPRSGFDRVLSKAVSLVSGVFFAHFLFWILLRAFER